MLVDTSVWINHLRKASADLEHFLDEGVVTTHPFVIGELACGSLRRRTVVLRLIEALPFTPVESMRCIRNLWNNYRTYARPASNPLWGVYGFKDAFNLGFQWVGTDYLGIDQGPILLMIENARTGKVWQRMMANADIQRGLASAGFQSYVLGVGGPHDPLAGLALAAPSPNPLHGSSSITYSLPRAGRVRLAVYDVTGRQVAVLAAGERAAGTHRESFDAAGLPDGVYLTRLEMGGLERTQRCVVLH